MKSLKTYVIFLGTDCDTECLHSSCNSNSLDLDSLPTEILLKIATNLGLKSKVFLEISTNFSLGLNMGSI